MAEWAQRLARAVAVILRGALAVFVGDGERFEIAGVGDGGDEPNGVFAHFRHRNHRQLPAHQVAFEGVVVDEHKGIEADVQLGGDAAEIGGLVVPIDGEGGDVAALQHHFRVPVEGFQPVRLIVFGAQCQDHAAACQFPAVVLEGEVCLAAGAALADDDALQPVVANDATPERIVEVENQAFGRAALVGGEQAGEQIAVERGGSRGDLLLGVVPEGGVVPGGEPVAGDAIVQRQEIDAGFVGHLPKQRVQLGDEGGARARQPVLVRSEQWRM